MADLHEVSRGLSLTDDNDNLVLDLLPSNGVPGTDADADAAPRGSIATNTLTGKLSTKISAGAGTAAWEQLATINDLSNSILTLPWKEAVLASDETLHANLAAAEAAVNTTTIDGVTVNTGDRLLFTNITGATGIYTIVGTPGAGATLSLTETPEDGDTVYTQEGTANADSTYAFNGTAWAQTSAGSSAELQAIRDFIGKVAAGASLPDYTSNNFILDNDSLVAALSKIDVALGTTDATATALALTVTNNKTELDNFEVSVGSAVNPADGTFVAFSGTSLIDAATSLTNALTLLDTAIGANQDDADIRNFIGKSAAGAELPAYTSEVHIADGDTLELAIDKLDAAVDKRDHRVESTGHIGTAVVDSVLVDEIRAVEWHISVQEQTGQGTRVVFTHGAHDGSATTDATAVDRSEQARLRIGNVAGFQTRVLLSGTGVTQEMQLQLRTNNLTDVVITRRTLY